MPFHIVPTTDLSLADLVSLHRDGAFVHKTPHVGNIYPNNLAMAAIGIPLLLVDRTIGEKDKNFHPHLVIADGKAEKVADARKMTSHARIQRVSERAPGRFVPGASLVDAHVCALRDVFPKASIETTSQRERRLADIVMPFLEIMTSISPESWERVVRSDGFVERHPPPRCWSEVCGLGIQSSDPPAAGWVVPNAWNILLDGVVGTLLSGRHTVYELSGPDMIRYYRGFVRDLSVWYDAIRHRFDHALPKTIIMQMVPVADMRLVTTKRRAPLLSTLVDTYLELLKAKGLAGDRLRHSEGIERDALIVEIQSVRGRLLKRLQRAANDCPEIFYRIEDANYLTQYDLLAGEDLFVHPWGVETPLAGVNDMIQFLRRSLRGG